MRSSIFAAVVLTLVSGIALTQESLQSPSAASEKPAARPATKPLTVSGKVSSDGRSLLTDIDTEWSISNAGVLKGREGTLVTVKCYVDSERTQLHVLSVRSAQLEPKYASRSGDSAFRR